MEALTLGKCCRWSHAELLWQYAHAAQDLIYHQVLVFRESSTARVCEMSLVAVLLSDFGYTRAQR